MLKRTVRFLALERCLFAQATIESKTVKKFIIKVFVLILHCTESSATYYRSLTDAKTRRTLFKTDDHKATCRRQARKRDVSFKIL